MKVRTSTAIIAAMFLAVIGLGVWELTRKAAQDRREQARCVAGHGQVTEVHAGRGGWICIVPLEAP